MIIESIAMMLKLMTDTIALVVVQYTIWWTEKYIFLKKVIFVTIYKVIEYDLKNKQINILEPKEFLKNNKDADYEKLMGLYNFGTYQRWKKI